MTKYIATKQAHSLRALPDTRNGAGKISRKHPQLNRIIQWETRHGTPVIIDKNIRENNLVWIFQKRD